MLKWEHYLTPNGTYRRLGMACLGVGRQDGAKWCPPRVLDCYAAVLVAAGAGRLESGPTGSAYRLTAPTLFWLFPGVPHAYGPDRHGWDEIWTLFEGQAAEAYEDLGYLSRSDPVVTLTDPTAVRHTMARLVDTCHGGAPGVEADAAHLVHELVLTAGRARDDRESTSGAAILAALRDTACGPLSMAQQAARIGLSTSALRRAVRRAAGCSPKEYTLQVRLNRAKVLLADSDLTVAEVGRNVGYDDAAYFTRVFTARAGMSPRSFRRQQRRAQ